MADIVREYYSLVVEARRLLEDRLRGSVYYQGMEAGATPALIRKRYASCAACGRAGQRTNIVFGAGPTPALVMIVGPAPSADDDARGAPFCGAAGELFDRMLAAIKLTRAEMYLTCAVKCTAGEGVAAEGGPPSPCVEILNAEIGAVRPRVICAMGDEALAALAGPGRTVRECHGRIIRRGDARVLPTFDPAFLAVHPEYKRQAWEDLKTLRAEHERHK